MTRFRHSGKMGDIVYSLPAVRAYAPAALFLRPGLAFGLEQANLLLPLLRAQPYIGHAAFADAVGIDCDLDGFRHQGVEENNLVDCHLRLLGLDENLKNEAWLDVEDSGELPRGTVLFGRSLHHIGIDGFWETCMEVFEGRAVFVGTGEEYRVFTASYGVIPFRPTRDMLELAQLIKQAAVFVGNQSCPYAIAEGLKRPTIQHVYAKSPNCIFNRADALYVRDAGDLEKIALSASAFSR